MSLRILPLTLLLLVPITAESDPASPEVRFAVIGDYGLDGQPEADVAALVASWSPDFVTTTGDNNYFNGLRTEIDANIGKHFSAFIFPYTGIFGPGALENRFWPVLGNHDWYSGEAVGCQPYLDYFSLPGNERYYEIRRGPVHLLMLDSDSNEPDGITASSVQGQWLQRRLRASGAPWRVVHLHHAPFSSSSAHGSIPTFQWPYLEWGADIVLAGHDHTYERLFADGLPHVVNGIGGRSIYGFGPPIAESIVRHNADYGAMDVHADRDAMRLQFLNRSGTVIDTLDMPPWRLDGQPEPNLTPASSVSGEDIWVDRVGDWLYVGATSTQPTGDDRFIYIARSPGPPLPAGGVKAGQVAAWDLFLHERAGNRTPTWHDALGAALPATAEAEAFNFAGTLLEGAFNMRMLWGDPPDSVFVATARWASADGGALDPATQVPPAGVSDGDLTADEFLSADLPPHTESGHPWLIDGQPESGLSPVAESGGLRLFVSQQREWLWVAADAGMASGATNDLFLYISQDPGLSLEAAAWGKTGDVGSWQLVLAREGASTFNGWHAPGDAHLARVSRFHSACEDGQLLEGAFNMLQAWGEVPSVVYLSLAEYSPGTGGALDPLRQVPFPTTPDGTIQEEEFLGFALATVPAELVLLSAD